MGEMGIGERNTSDRIFNGILEQINSGALTPGQRLPSENEMKESYGVSRNTIRLVLNKLCALGIVETRRGDGSYVRKAGANVSLNMMAPGLIFEKHDLVDILEFRKAVEVYAVRLAAQRAGPRDIAKMKACLKQMKKYLESMREFEMADTDMHIQIAKATKNEMFGSMMEIIRNVLTHEMKAMLVKQGKDIDSYFYHSAIVECIESRKPDEAAYMMEKHLNLIVERIKAGRDG